MEGPQAGVQGGDGGEGGEPNCQGEKAGGARPPPPPLPSASGRPPLSGWLALPGAIHMRCFNWACAITMAMACPRATSGRRSCGNRRLQRATLMRRPAWATCTTMARACPRATSGPLSCSSWRRCRAMLRRRTTWATCTTTARAFPKMSRGGSHCSSRGGGRQACGKCPAGAWRGRARGTFCGGTPTHGLTAPGIGARAWRGQARAGPSCSGRAV
jgi:hypothetical protein